MEHDHMIEALTANGSNQPFEAGEGEKIRRCPCCTVLEFIAKMMGREVGEGKERPRAVAVPSAVGWAVTLKPEPPPLGAVMPP